MYAKHMFLTDLVAPEQRKEWIFFLNSCQPGACAKSVVAKVNLHPLSSHLWEAPTVCIKKRKKNSTLFI